MPQQIDIPNVGLVEFPDGMSDSDIVGAIKTNIIPRYAPPLTGLPSIPSQSATIRSQEGLPSLEHSFAGQGSEEITKPLVAPELLTHPGVMGGLANSLVKGLASLTSPLGVATAPATLIKPLQIPLMGLFAGLGAKGVGQGLGQLTGTPNQSPGQIAESLGDVTQSALMTLPGLAHVLPEAKGAPVVPVHMRVDPGRPLSVDEINARAGLLPNNGADVASTSPPETPVSAGSPVVSPFDKGKVMAATPEVVPPVEAPKAPSDWEQYQNVQRKMATYDFGSPEFNTAWKENEVIKNRNGGMPPKDPSAPVPPLTFQPAVKIGDQVINGPHNPLVQKAYMDAQAAGQPRPVVLRGFAGSNGTFLTNPLDVLRAQQKAKADETATQSPQQQETGGASPQGREEEQEGRTASETQSPVGQAQSEVPTDARANGERALGDNQQGVGGRIAQSGSANEPNRKTTDESGFTLVPKEVWPKLGFAKDFKVAGEMLYNRLRNVIGDTSATWQALQSAGLRDFLKEKRTTEEVKKWVEENSPKVEVRKFQGGSAQAGQEVARIEHLLDTNYKNWSIAGSDGRVNLHDPVTDSFTHFRTPEEIPDKYKDVRNLLQQYRDNYAKWDNHDSQTHWQSIAPKSESDMPGYVEIAVVKPTKGDKVADSTIKQAEYNRSVQFPSSHNFPPNTLGFTRGYMENVGGKKVFHVIEVQSDWAQRVRQEEQSFQEHVTAGRAVDTDMSRVGYSHLTQRRNQDPLLPHYERLALKAAIEHARSEGASHIALSDAETAMMTEGHDRQAHIDEVPDPQMPGYIEQKATISQENGMRLHYDQTLPKILSDLTGQNGERVEMGEHQMAFDTAGERPTAVSNPRKNLIFRNPDGTPKTSVTGRMYPIGEKNPTPEFSLFGKDKGEAASIFPRWEKTGTARTIAEIRKAAKDPSPAMKAVLLAGNAARKKLINSVRTAPNKAIIVADKDAADNKAVIAGQQARMGLDAQARVSFGSEYDKVLKATTALVESGNDKAQLQKFVQIAKAKNDTLGIEAAQFAFDNYDKMQLLLAKTVGLHDDQLMQEQAVGLGTNSRENYIRHVFDVDKLPTAVQDKFLGAGEGNGPRGFMKMRAFDTLYDAIEAGYGPAIKTWDAGSLAESRIKNGQQMVNDTTWLAGLRGIKDPTTKLPITENLVQRKNPQTDDVDLVPPPGYDKFSLPTGQSFAVHKGYGNLLKSVTSLSAIQKAEVMGLPVGKWALQSTGALKHSMLMFDTFHAIRMAAKGASLGVKGFEKGASLLEYHPSDLDNALKAGDIDRATYDYVKTNAPKGMFLVQHGLNVGRVAEALYADAIHALPIASDFNKWVFEKETRGVMMESAIKEFDRVKAASPGLGDREVARKVARDMNIYFGNLGRQGLFRSKTFQDLSRLLFLAPSWFESMARTEAGSVRQAGKYLGSVGKKPLGSLAKGTGSLLFAMFVGTQLVNQYTRRQFTWQNDEPGHKLDAWIPGGKAGFWVSPFSLPMEITHDIIRYTAQGKSPLDTVSQIVGNKLSPVVRAEEVLRTGRDYTGQKLPDGQRVKTAAANLLPLPLPLQPLVKKGYPGQVQRQVLASAGIKTEPANTSSTVIANLRRQFLYKIGKAQQADYPVSEYDDLRTALLNGDAKTAQVAYDKLYAEKLVQHQNDANPEREAKMDFQKYFEKFAKAQGGASKEDEAAFVQTLTPHQQDLYQKVQDSQAAASQLFFNEVQGKLMKKQRGMKF